MGGGTCKNLDTIQKLEVLATIQDDQESYKRLIVSNGWLRVSAVGEVFKYFYRAPCKEEEPITREQAQSLIVLEYGEV